MANVTNNTTVAAFETENGESVAVFYRPNCTFFQNNTDYFQSYLCANFIVDLNGGKGPNTAGKDITFISVFYPTDFLVLAPEPLREDSGVKLKTSAALTVCRGFGSDYRLPTREEMASIAINSKFYPIGSATSQYYITSTKNAVKSSSPQAV